MRVPVPRCEVTDTTHRPDGSVVLTVRCVDGTHRQVRYTAEWVGRHGFSTILERVVSEPTLRRGVL